MADYFIDPKGDSDNSATLKDSKNHSRGRIRLPNVVDEDLRTVREGRSWGDGPEMADNFTNPKGDSDDLTTLNDSNH